MLYTQKLIAELERKLEHFTGYQARYGQQLAAYRDALASLGERYATAHTLSSVQAIRLDQRVGPYSAGARPTHEYDLWQSSRARGEVPRLSFGQTFAHHEAARSWAECLRGTTTLAVDGSQLLPWRDASVPVALVQAGLFENPHDPAAGSVTYTKDVVTQLLSPDDLLTAVPDIDARSGEALGYSTQIVHLHRFELEVNTLVSRMRHHARQSAEQRSAGKTRIVAFYDGSLIVSFALKMPLPYRDRYVTAARQLLTASLECRVPLVGYIDTSYARDIVTMLGTLQEDLLPETVGIHDALLWIGSLEWGDRTPAFISAREDLSSMGYREQQEDVAFAYFQASLDRPPARLEFPRWVLEAGLLDDVLDVVRGEVIVGNGYPYSVEAADAVAVISNRDRAQFYSIFQAFAESEGLEFGFSRKALSKDRRRV